MNNNAPVTTKIIDSLLFIKDKNSLTYGDIRRMINHHLPNNRQIRSEKQIERWMRTDSKTWPEPRAEVILAIQTIVSQTAFR
jgi:hypothetical protein